MKLVNLLDVIEFETVIWISKPDDADGVFLGFAEDADANTPQNYLFGEVKDVYAQIFQSHNERAGISILVDPYTPRGPAAAATWRACGRGWTTM